jgi:hypothetical protein
MKRMEKLGPIGRIGLIFTWVVSAASAVEIANMEAWHKVEKVLSTYCFDCHDNDTQKGKLNLEALPKDFLDSQSAGSWIEVMDNINASEMPPEDKKQPTAAERAFVADWIAGELRHARQQANATGGRALLRRLTRTEYENTVQDLLGVVFEPKQNPLTLLPPDGSMDGFDKVSQGLVLDPSLMETYFEVASIVADRAIQLGDPPVPTIRSRLETEEYETGLTPRSIHRQLDRSKTLSPDGTGVITVQDSFRTFGQLQHPFNDQLIPVSGKYAIRFRAGTDPGNSNKPIIIELSRGGTGAIYYGTIPGTLEEPSEHEVIMELDAKGGGEMGMSLVERPEIGGLNRYEREFDRKANELSSGGKMKEAGFIKARLNAEGHYGMGRADLNMLDLSKHPKLYLDYIEIEGPLYDQWPPKSVSMILPRGLNDSLKTPEYLREIISNLLPKAYRRHVSQEEIDLVFKVGLSEGSAEKSFESALKASIITILCSPSFLYIVEPAQDNQKRKLTQFELSSRLSYFLWSTMPDMELFRDADSGKLLTNLDAQISRMLNHAKSEALVEGFAKQWLKAGEFNRFAPDRNSYRRFYENQFKGINEDLNEEPIAFFREIVNNGGDLRDFLSCNWTMANERLANWYGLPEGSVKGEEFVRVILPENSPRGGLLGMGAIHKWGSDGSRTKPVDRGKYVLEVLFNDPPNPPPPNVGEVEPNVQGENLTVRERLEAHREIESCANCHSRLDPYGLAMENFNVAGMWRDYQDGENRYWGQSEKTRIKAVGSLPNGTTFETFQEYKAVLRAMEVRFFRGFSEKLFTYAFSRAPEPVDRGLIDQMVEALKKGNGKFESAVRTIVLSEAFQMK